MKLSTGVVCVVALMSVGAHPALGQAGKSLHGCQTAVATETSKYIRAVTDTVGKCMRRMSKEIVERGATPEEAAVRSAADCVSHLRKLVNSEAPKKQIADKLYAKLGEKCDPAINPALSHLEPDTYAVGTTLPSAAHIGAYCGSFGGDGTIDSFRDWRDCVRRAADCQARQALALQWPRVLEYLAELNSALAALPASPKTVDASIAIDALETALEGNIDDNSPDLSCGPACGIDGISGGWPLTITGALACTGNVSIVVTGNAITSTVSGCRSNPTFVGTIDRSTGAFSMTETSSATCGSSPIVSPHFSPMGWRAP